MQSDVYAMIVLAWGNLYSGTSEVGCKLVETTARYLLFGAFDPIGRYWWMVRGLFGEIGDGKRLFQFLLFGLLSSESW